MKKLLIVLSFLLTFTFLTLPLIQAEPVAVEYNLTWRNDGAYSIIDGKFYLDSNKATTGKINIVNETILPIDFEAHYILFWSKTNFYIGYYRMLGNDDTQDKYLEKDYVSGLVDIPAGATAFALVIEKNGINRLSGLGEYTLVDIFSDPSFLDYEDDILTDTLGNIMGNPSFLNYEDDVITTPIWDVFTTPTYLNTNLDFFGSSLTLSEIIGNGLLVFTYYTQLTYPTLPNGVNNFIKNDGGTIKFVQRVQRYVLQSGDISAINTSSFTQFDIVSVNKQPNDIMVGNTNATLANAERYIISPFLPSTFPSNNASFIGKFYMVGTINLMVAKGTYATLSQAKTAFAGTVIYYQLATPIENTISNLIRNDAGTLFSSLTDVNIKTAMDGWQSNGYLFNDKLFQIYYMKNYSSQTLPTSSGWTYSYDENGFWYGSYQLPNYVSTSADDIIDSNYPINDYADWLISDGMFYHNGFIFYKNSGFTSDIQDLYSELTFIGAPSFRIELVTPLTDNEALYYWNLYKDSINEVNRFEWYMDKGITNENFSYYMQLYIDALTETDRWEFYKQGVNESNLNYYLQLYSDALAETPRWEFYRDYGITSSNYDSLKTLYDYYLPLDTITFEEFQAGTINFLTEEPSTPLTLKERIHQWLETDLGLSTLLINLICLLIMIIVIIPLALLKVRWYVYLIAELPLFAFFTVLELFSPITVIIITIVAILGFYSSLNN